MPIPLRSLALPTLAALVVLVVALAGAKSSPGGGRGKTSAVAHGKVAKIEISNYIYDPATLTVKVGTKITVTNHDATAHTLTAQQGGFDSGSIAAGKTVSFAVTKPGTYPYICQYHAFMHGTLKVVG